MTGTHATDWTGRIIMPFGICNAVRSRCVCTFIHFNVFNVNVYIAYRVCAFHECGFHLEHCTARKQNREREKKTAHKIYIRAQCWICVQKRRDTIILAMTLSLSLTFHYNDRPCKRLTVLSVFFFHFLFIPCLPSIKQIYMFKWTTYLNWRIIVYNRLKRSIHLESIIKLPMLLNASFNQLNFPSAHLPSPS